ncbi:sensor histidine kinase [Pedobacter sp. SL55]|uniref:sensor histidine kinase n=1 Tax=Pedobacter sp. SL55 TaxID=2995161 RepID=UPI00226DE83D|nr:histidine kinase [Pedobacter sp. SL55]WAC42523.1 histidine kinase [Pedobacter sp. SL55]
MKRIYIFVLLNLILIRGFAYGQTQRLSYRFNTTNTNLPSNNIYKIHCDKNGNVWLGTDKGLVKYNGTNFKTFNTQNGLADEDVVNLFYQPKENNIWALAFNSKITKINTLTNKTTNINPSNTKQKVIGAFMYAYQKADTLNFLNTLQIVSLHKEQTTVKSLKNIDYKTYLFANNQDYHFNKSLYEEVNWDLIQQKYFPTKKWWLKNTTRISKYGTVILDSEILFKSKDRVYRLLSIDQFIPGADKFIVDLEISGTDLYLAVFGREGGIYLAKNYLNNPKTAKLELISEKGYGISVAKDKIGNIWYTLQGKGLNVIGQSYLDVNLSPLTALTTGPYFIKAPTDDVVVINNPSEDRFFLLNVAKNTTNSYHKTDVPFTLNSIKSLSAFINPPHKALTKDISNDGRLYFSNSVAFYSADFKTKTEHLKSEKYNNIRGIRKGDYYQDKVLFSTSDDSLYVYDKRLQTITERIMLPQIGTIKDIYVQNNQLILFCTSKGVFATDFSFGKTKQISKGIFKKVVMSGQSAYFINDSELAYLDTKKGTDIATVFSTKSFLLRLNLLDFDVSRSKVHLLTDVGYIQFPKAKLAPLKNNADFNLAAITLKDTTLFYPTEKTILPDNKTKELLFTVQFLNPQHNNYQKSYSFEKQNDPDGWISFTGNNFVLTHLSPGSYLLKINVRLANVNLNQTMVYQIIIKPKFWQTTWFFMLVLLIFIAAIAYTTWLVVNHFQKNTLQKIKLENRIADIENKAFLNQLNPHFLYNALNALQDYIIQKDTHNGIIYLQRIASLHRNILEFNQKAHITVNDEKLFLEKYLFIQQKRYSDKFTFEIIADEDTKVMKLPPMLLQPIVENAIEHGFKGKTVDKHISILFKKENVLKITISDNGNGKLADLAELKEGHALYMIKERLNFINQKNNHHNNTIAFYANKPKGIITLLTIHLPI